MARKAARTVPGGAGGQEVRGRPGLPRDQAHDFDDPYLPDAHPEEEAVCPECGAVYARQRWMLDEERGRILAASGAGRERVCPGCRKVAERYAQGIVRLRGDYWSAHRDDLLNLIRNEESRGRSTNPLERIIQIYEEEGSLLVETTNEKLAQRIGRAVRKAHQGRLTYQWPDNNRLVRVEWER